MTIALEAEGIGIATVVVHDHTSFHPILFKGDIHLFFFLNLHDFTLCLFTYQWCYAKKQIESSFEF